jgi:hypothetical protein
MVLREARVSAQQSQLRHLLGLLTFLLHSTFSYCQSNACHPCCARCASRHEEVQGDYSELLASSAFCLMLPGDGWSARMEDAMLHGQVCRPWLVLPVSG